MSLASIWGLVQDHHRSPSSTSSILTSKEKRDQVSAIQELTKPYFDKREKILEEMRPKHEKIASEWEGINDRLNKALKD